MPSKKLDIQPIILGNTRVIHPSSSRPDGTVPGKLVQCHSCEREYGVCTGDLSRGRGLFCSRSCSGIYRRRTQEQVFWEYVHKTNECWEWTGWKDPLGYGHVNLADNKRWLAHRLSWVIHFGNIPDKLVICHQCDNSSCVRPDHLFIGTQKDNIYDAIDKGRAPNSSVNV